MSVLKILPMFAVALIAGWIIADGEVVAGFLLACISCATNFCIAAEVGGRLGRELARTFGKGEP